jgi:hypothetical protein
LLAVVVVEDTNLEVVPLVLAVLEAAEPVVLLIIQNLAQELVLMVLNILVLVVAVAVLMMLVLHLVVMDLLSSNTLFDAIVIKTSILYENLYCWWWICRLDGIHHF